MRIFHQLFAFSVVLLSIGCSPNEPEHLLAEILSEAKDAQALEIEKNEVFEVFVFVALLEKDRSQNDFESLLLTGLQGSAVCHLVACPEHRLIASIDVPYGSPKARMKNRLFTNQYAAVKRFFEEPIGEKLSDQLGLPTISETISGLRQTDLPCRVVLCGTPIFNAPSCDATFSMEGGMAPSPGLIGHPSSPWVTNPLLPSDTKVSWLTSGSRWGNNLHHRQAALHFYQMYFQSLRGHLARITPDPAIAYSFAEPFLESNISPLDNRPVMIDTGVETRLGPENQGEPVVIPVEKPKVNLSANIPSTTPNKKKEKKVESAKPQVFMQLVVDGSGSMCAHLSNDKTLVLLIADSLAAKVQSLEIGISIHRDTGVVKLPIMTVKDREHDGGKSLKKLEYAFLNIRAKDSDAQMRDMVEYGMNQFSINDRKRQALVIITDHDEFSDAEGARLIEELNSWHEEPDAPKRISLISYASTEEGRKRIRELRGKNGHKNVGGFIESILSDRQ